jgi:hypothetical protein
MPCDGKVGGENSQLLGDGQRPLGGVLESEYQRAQARNMRVTHAVAQSQDLSRVSMTVGQDSVILDREIGILESSSSRPILIYGRQPSKVSSDRRS